METTPGALEVDRPHRADTSSSQDETKPVVGEVVEQVFRGDEIATTFGSLDLKMLSERLELSDIAEIHLRRPSRDGIVEGVMFRDSREVTLVIERYNNNGYAAYMTYFGGKVNRQPDDPRFLRDLLVELDNSTRGGNGH